MKIYKSSWHYRLYKFSYDNSPGSTYTPNQTSLCQYVRRLCMMVPLIAAWCAFVLVVVVIAVVTFGPFVLVGQLLSGSYPTRVVWVSRRFTGSYAPFKTFGVQWYPLHLVALMAAYAVAHIVRTATKPDPEGFFALFFFVIAIGSWLAARSAVNEHNLRARQAEAESVEVKEEQGILAAYLKARKEEFCPTVTFD